MVRFHGGEQAGKGTYWNILTGERVDLGGTSFLPGGRNDTFLRLPGFAVLVFGPALGLAFAIFLPFIAIVMTLTVGMRKVGAVLMTATGRSMSFGWRPMESFLAGMGRVKKRRQETSPKDSVPR